MGYLSDFTENELLDHVLMVGSYSRPANLFLACSAKALAFLNSSIFSKVFLTKFVIILVNT